MVTPTSWPCPLPAGGTFHEYALAFDRDRAHRLLIAPALLDEGNKLRRFTVELMRRLDLEGVDSFLPDYPGSNESLQALSIQDPTDWIDAMRAAAVHFGATHALGLRGGCLFTPDTLPCLHYAPLKAASILRQLLRARMLASRENGAEETREGLAAQAEANGIVLAGYSLGADFYHHFEPMIPSEQAEIITQEALGGPGLWLRAEPGEDASQSAALARLITASLAP
ncbi:hypothetical protein [Novosphingobium sp. 9]|uniref:hypothetical protein n=1 Tax=Novosphingobium sp. 9 TaxID=2025349 RepID=UPI0028CBB24A|nr:hypothetical protein [Novosphingobium sp. 9]